MKTHTSGKIQRQLMTISQTLSYGCSSLVRSESAEIDSQFLLCHLLNCQTSYLHSRSEQTLTQQQQQQFEQLVKQRQQGKPISHITGQRGFWTLDLNVTADTLIPRPDTELLVDLALEKLRPKMVVADLGTGNGAIALSLAQQQTSAQILAMDQSWPALLVAQGNAANYKLTNIHFWQGQWLAAIADQSLDVVISNPPYIKNDDPHLKQGDVRFEPLSALVSGGDGLDDIRIIVKQAHRCLKPAGYLLVEHGYDQAQYVQQLFEDAGFIEVSSQQDFGGNDRVMMAKK